MENLGYFALDNKSAAVMMEKLLIVVLFVFLVECILITFANISSVLKLA